MPDKVPLLIDLDYKRLCTSVNFQGKDLQGQENRRPRGRRLRQRAAPANSECGRHALENHVYRHPRLGLSVIINETWY